MEIRPLHPVLGAEVLGFGLGNDVPCAVFGLLRDAFNRNAVLVFRDQEALTPAQHVAFSRRFGPLEVRPTGRFLHPAHPEILIVSNEMRGGAPIGVGNADGRWRCIGSFTREPSMGCLLHAQILPEEGGDTLFASMVEAYQRVPDALRDRIDRMCAEHHRGAADAPATAVHPMVRLHEESRQPVLFVNEGFTTRIVGVAETESAEILRHLFALSIEPELVYRHRWRDGDLVMWDNRAVIHRAAGCPLDMPCTLHRTAIRGGVPFGVG